MCGIFAFAGSKGISLEKAIQPIHHRGPDSDGYLTFDRENGGHSPEGPASLKDGPKVALGFKRLSIIDLSSHANQPFSDRAGKYHIVFNGEIYNYLEIKKELQAKGVEFHTTSDTEVLLQAYIQWGEDCVSRFNGMWAFVIYDQQAEKLFVARDRFGIKPLYFHRSEQGLYFFSEIKQAFAVGIEKKINPAVIRDFLESSVLDAGEQTFFAGIHKFPSSHFAVIDLRQADLQVEPRAFFQLQEKAEYNNLSYDEAQEQFRQLFTSSIELRFRSDVPVGACLSGGLDSSSIVSLAGHLGKNIQAFTVDNKESHLSEYKYVQEVVRKYPNISSVVTYNSLQDTDMLDDIFAVQDEPISGLGVLAQWRVMELARQNNVTVLLDGQGGDEILGGYRKYLFFYLKQLLQNGSYLKAMKEASRFLSHSEFQIFQLEGVRRYLNKTGVENYLSAETLKTERNHNIGISGASGFRQKSFEDIFYYSYPQLLRYEDRNSMAFSLESRVPFLDYRLVEFVYSLPSSYKIRNGYTKAILRDSLKGILPEAIRTRKSKLGFATPEESWLKGKDYPAFVKYFESMDNPFLDNQKIAADFRSKKSKLDYKSMIRLYLFDRWYKHQFGQTK